MNCLQFLGFPLKYYVQETANTNEASKDVACLFISYGKSHVTSSSSRSCCMLTDLSNTHNSLYEPAFSLIHAFIGLSKAPENIILHGDCSGRNLAIALMPIPYIPTHPTKIKRIVFILTTTLRGKRFVLAVCVPLLIYRRYGLSSFPSSHSEVQPCQSS